MATQREPEDLRQVAAQSAWVRQLAVALARDVHAGEDIAQDALLAATRHQQQPGSLRAWLAGAVRNLARLRRRAEGRRVAREYLSARPERCDDPLIAFERLELQEALIGAVRELPEPYRTTVLLRWFEELEPEAIAQRTSTPVRTVHTRLHRALALLRESLERRSQGDRSRWLAAWLPLLSKSKGSWTWLAMNLKVVLGVAGLACAGVFSIWVASNPARVHEPEQALAAGVSGEPVAPAATRPSELESVSAESSRLEPAVPSRTRDQAAVSDGCVLHGQVIDVSGARLPGVEVVFRAVDAAPGVAGPRAMSDQTGRFELALDAQRGNIRLATSEWIVVHSPEIPLPDPQAECVLVLGKPRSIEGLVVDPSGKPLPDIAVLALDPLISTEVQGRLQDISSESGSPWNELLNAHPVMTDVAGHFRLEGLVAEGYRLLAKSDRTLERTVSEPIRVGATEALIVLGDAGGLCSFAGRVVDLQGNPIAGASLAAMRTVSRKCQGTPLHLEADRVTPDESGRFEMSGKSCELEGFIVWPEPSAPARIVLLDRGANRSALLLRVGHITHVQVELRTPGLRADSAEFLDASGVVCQTGVKRGGGGWNGGGSMSISSEGSGVRMVSEEATTLVLLLGGKEVKCVPIHLDRETVNVLRP